MRVDPFYGFGGLMPETDQLEARFGYDTKHAVHLVRLLRMCREILERGEVVVKRPDREELLSIRNGTWSYEQLVQWATEQDRDMQRLYAESTLPRAPDTARFDALCIEIVEDGIGTFTP